MILKRSLVKVTPKKASELLRLNTYPGQRNKLASHIQVLAKKIEDGRFHQGQVAIVHNGSDFLADGQHQCEAGIVSGLTFHATRLDYYVEKGDTKEDVAQVFAQFNVDRSRSRSDIAWIYGCQVGMDEWPKRCVTLCNTALGWLESGCNASGTIALGKDENSRLLSANKAACDFIFSTIFSEHQKSAVHLRRSPVAAAMIATHRVDENDAEAFWLSVRDGAMLKKTDPAFVLREFLLRTSVKVGGGESVTQREMYGKCIIAWNAYRTKKPTKLNFYAGKPLPKPV